MESVKEIFLEDKDKETMEDNFENCINFSKYNFSSELKLMEKYFENTK